MQLNTKNQTASFKNRQRIWIDFYFFTEDIQIDKQYMKRCSASLTNREMQIKTTMKYYLTVLGITVIKKTGNKCWKECGGKQYVICW